MQSMAGGLARLVAGGPIAAPDLDQDARDRALVERLSGQSSSASGAKAGRRSQLWTVPEERERRGFTLGWKMSLFLDIAMIATPIPLVVALPPFAECRERERTIGFFVGDSMQACTIRGIRARWHRLDSRLKMLVRNSGQ